MGDWRQLVEILKKLDPAKDATAATYLTSMSDAEIISAVKELQISSPKAAAALGRLGGARIIQPLRNVLRHPDYQLSMGASNALSSIDSPEALPALAELLQDSESEARAAAARSLGKIGSAGFDLLSSALEDTDRFVRQAAAKALGMLGDSRAVGKLIQAIESEETVSTKRALVEALDKLRDSQAVMPLVRAALKDETLEGEVFSQVRVALYNIGASEAVPFLVESLRAPESRVRCSAASLLGRFGDESALGPLTTLLRDPDKKVQKAGRSALSDLGRKYPAAEDAVVQYDRARLSSRSCPCCGQAVHSEQATPYAQGCVCASCGWAGIWCYECGEAAMEMGLQGFLHCPQCQKRSLPDRQIIAWLRAHGF